MKKIVTAFFLLLLISPIVTSTEFPILDKQVEIRQAHLTWITTIQEIRMQAAIEYLSNISEGQALAQLEGFLADLQEQQGIISILTTHVALNEALRQMQQITSDFKEELRIQMITYDGKIVVLLNYIQIALQDNESMLLTLEDTYWMVRQTNELQIFNTRVANAQAILTILTQKEYNTTEAQEKLDDIQSVRAELEAAYEARDQNQIHTLNMEVLMLSNELRQIVKELQIQIPSEKKVQYWIHVGERAVERTATIVSELEKLGLNVTSLQQIQGQAEEDLETAQDAFAANDTQGAIDALHDLKADLIALKDAYHMLILQGMVSGDVKTVLEQTQTALDDTIDGMENIE